MDGPDLAAAFTLLDALLLLLLVVLDVLLALLLSLLLLLVDEDEVDNEDPPAPVGDADALMLVTVAEGADRTLDDDTDTDTDDEFDDAGDDEDGLMMMLVDDVFDAFDVGDVADDDVDDDSLATCRGASPDGRPAAFLLAAPLLLPLLDADLGAITTVPATIDVDPVLLVLFDDVEVDKLEATPESPIAFTLIGVVDGGGAAPLPTRAVGSSVAIPLRRVGVAGGGDTAAVVGVAAPSTLVPLDGGDGDARLLFGAITVTDSALEVVDDAADAAGTAGTVDMIGGDDVDAKAKREREV